MSDYYSGLGALLSTANSAANNISISNAQRKDRKFMRQENEKNREFAREMNEWNYNIWKEGLKYDSPAAQYQRYLDAGLNPAYFMGEAQGSGVSSPQSADLTDKFDPFSRNAQYQSLQSDNYLSNATTGLALADLKLKKKQVENETRKLYRTEDITNAQIANLIKDGKLKDYQAQELQFKVDEAEEKVNQAKEITNRYKLENVPLQYQAKKFQFMMDNEYEKVEASLKYLDDFGKAYESAGKGSVYYTALNAVNRFLDFADQKFKDWGIKIKDFEIKQLKVPLQYGSNGNVQHVMPNNN